MFGKKKEIETPIEVSAPVQEKPVFVPSQLTKIGPGVTLIGDFDTHDKIEIDGVLKGSIETDNDVYVSRRGKLEGIGHMKALIAEGLVDGDLDCSDIATITATGNMVGNLSAVKLQTEPGACFNGNLKLVNQRQAAAVPEAAPAADATPVAEQ